MVKSVHVAVGEITPRTYAEVTSAFESPDSAFKKYVPRDDPFITPLNLMHKFDAVAADSLSAIRTSSDASFNACEALIALLDNECCDDIDEFLVDGCFDRVTPNATKPAQRVTPTAISELGTEANPIVID